MTFIHRAVRTAPGSSLGFCAAFPVSFTPSTRGFFFSDPAGLPSRRFLLLVGPSANSNGRATTHLKGVDRRRPARWRAGAPSCSTSWLTHAAPRMAAGI